MERYGSWAVNESGVLWGSVDAKLVTRFSLRMAWPRVLAR